MNEEEFEVTKGNIFEDLGLEEVEDLTVRSDLLSEINQIIRSSKLKQKDVAHLLNISPPKVSMLLNGKLSAFSTDTLMKYLCLLGCSVQILVHGRKPFKSGICRGKFSVARHKAKSRTHSSLKRTKSC